MQHHAASECVHSMCGAYKTPRSDMCYYHHKVRQGLIDGEQERTEVAPLTRLLREWDISRLITRHA